MKRLLRKFGLEYVNQEYLLLNILFSFFHDSKSIYHLVVDY
jgi:hypothetical protein